MNAEILTNRLRDPLPGWEYQKRMSTSHTTRELSNSFRNAAVLIALFEIQGRWYFPLIRRVEDGFTHSGQMALPGGRVDRGESIRQAALREAEEEVSIDPKSVQVLGELSQLPVPVSSHLVHPVIGILNSPPRLKPDPSEVADVFAVGIEELLDDNSLGQETIRVNGFIIDAPCFRIKGQLVWGATAMILSEFREILRSVLD